MTSSDRTKVRLVVFNVVIALLLCVSAARPVLAKHRHDERWRWRHHHHGHYYRHGSVYDYYNASPPEPYYYYEPPPVVYAPPPPPPPGINFIFRFHH